VDGNGYDVSLSGLLHTHPLAVSKTEEKWEVILKEWTSEKIKNQWWLEKLS